MFLALAILFYIVLLHVVCVYVWTVVSAGSPALLFLLIDLCTCDWLELYFDERNK